MNSIGWTAALLMSVAQVEVGNGIAARVESPRATVQDQIRQHAFDGDAATTYASTGDGPVSFVFDQPIRVNRVRVNGHGLEGVKLEVSPDGKEYREVSSLGENGGTAEPAETLASVRVVPANDRKLEIVEVVIDAEPKLGAFEFPVEFVVDEVDDPALKDWAEKAARECERAYDLINRTLGTEKGTAPKVVRLSVKDGIDVPAYAGGGRITGSTAWFRDHPEDVGAMIHEATHIVQRYRGRRNPGWLVEGVADYVRFIVYEPANIGPINADRAKYDQSYRVSARFLDHVVRNYDAEFVKKLDRAMKERTYSDEMFREATGKSLEELGEEWKRSLSTKATAGS